MRTLSALHIHCFEKYTMQACVYFQQSFYNGTPKDTLGLLWVLKLVLGKQIHFSPFLELSGGSRSAQDQHTVADPEGFLSIETPFYLRNSHFQESTHSSSSTRAPPPMSRCRPDLSQNMLKGSNDL